MAIVPFYSPIIPYRVPLWPRHYPLAYYPYPIQPYYGYSPLYYPFYHPTLYSYLDPYGLTDSLHMERVRTAHGNPGNFWRW